MAGKSGGVVDAVVDGETGFLVDPENVGEIADKIAMLLKDSQLRARLGRQGKERVEREFTWEKQAQKLRYILE